MGISSTITRNHMRPFGGRSPPFLVATLCVGLCVLAVSYWRLGIQYTDLEEQLRRLIQKKDSLEANESFISKQLELREENFSEAKVSLQKKEKELLDLKKTLDDDDAKIQSHLKAQNDLKNSLEKIKTELKEKVRMMSELQNKNDELKAENLKMKTEFDDYKTKCNQSVKNNLRGGSPSPYSNQVIAAPDSVPVNKNKAIEMNHKTNEGPKSNLPAPDLSQKSKPSKDDEDDDNQIDNKNDGDTIHHQEMEQIKKPLIDPIVNMIKNPIGSKNEGINARKFANEGAIKDDLNSSSLNKFFYKISDQNDNSNNKNNDDIAMNKESDNGDIAQNDKILSNDKDGLLESDTIDGDAF
ncbi:glutamate receptor [Sarcoptes scabiei]|nr:glutamate receptor [Sarcoptes scabiei]